MKLFNSVSPNLVAKLLAESGFQGKLERGDDFVYVRSGEDGWAFNVRFWPMTSNESEPSSSFQFWAFWPINAEDIEFMADLSNQFNSEYRYVSTFITSFPDKTYFEISLDHYCPDGISDATFIGLMKLFTDIRRAIFSRSQEVYHERKGKSPAQDETPAVNERIAH